MNTRRTPRVQIVSASEEHDEALAEFFRLTWDPEATSDDVREARRRQVDNPVAPGSAYPTHLATVDDAVVGYLTSIPVRFWIDGRAVAGWWGKGLMVLPEHRNGPLGVLLVRAQSQAVPHLGSLAVNPAALRLFQASGLTEVGALPNRLLPLRPEALLPLLDGSALSLDTLPGFVRTLAPLVNHRLLRPATSLLARLAGWSMRQVRSIRTPSGQRVDEVAEVPPDLDELWSRASPQMAAGVVRDTAHYESIYGNPIRHPYAGVAVRQGGVLTGFGVVRGPKADGDARLQGARVSVLSDAIFRPTDQITGKTLLAGAERAAERFGSDALLLSATDPRLNGLARSRGYIRLPSNVRYLVRLPVDDLPAIEHWWLTRGDGGADDAF